MKNQFKIVLAITALAVAAMACGIPSIPGLPSLGGPLLQDDFGGIDQPWGTGTDSDSSVEYLNGGLEFKVFTPQYFIWSGPNTTNYQNVHIEVTAKNNNSDQDTAFGLVCNQQVTKSAFYYLAMTANGQYVIAKAAVAQDDVFLTNNAEWGDSDLIAKNASSYRLGADCGNGVITFYVDGQQVATVTDATYTDGYVALFAWSHDQQNGADITFDDFAITDLK